MTQKARRCKKCNKISLEKDMLELEESTPILGRILGGDESTTNYYCKGCTD